MLSQFAAYGSVLLEAGCIAKLLQSRIAKRYPALLCLLAIDSIRTALLLWVADFNYSSHEYAAIWLRTLPFLWLALVAATYEVFSKIGRQTIDTSPLMRWAAIPGALVPLLWFLLWGDYAVNLTAIVSSFRFANRCVFAACLAALAMQALVTTCILGRKLSFNLGRHRTILLCYLASTLTGSLLTSLPVWWSRNVGDSLSVTVLYGCCFAWMFLLRSKEESALEIRAVSAEETVRRERRLRAIEIRLRDLVP